MIKFLLTAFVFLTTSLTLHAQKEANHWLWGDSTRMDFTGGSPVTYFKGHLLGSGNANAVISHKETGELLFYTDGSVVRDTTGNIMLNGKNLLADEVKFNQSAAKGAIIIPEPGSKNRYYIFNAAFSGIRISPYPAVPGLYYSIVDMSLNNGRGDVAIKHIPLPLINNASADFITATRDCNGIDYWIIAHYRSGHKFYAYKLSATGVTGPVITSYLNDRPEYQKRFSNHKMIFSPSGRRLVMSNPFLDAKNATIEMLDFNPATGTFTNEMRLEVKPIDNSSGFGGEAFAFSSDNSKLYIITQRVINNKAEEHYLFQYSLESGDKDSIMASRKLISSFNGWASDMQLAQDGKIYILLGTQLAAIEKPNLEGTACAFSMKSGLKGELSGFYPNLPNFPNFYFNEKPNIPCSKPTSLFKAYSPICEGSFANFTDESENEPDYRKWEFPGGMPSVFIGKNPPPIYYAKAGTYTVRLITKNVFGSNLLELKQVVHPLPQIITTSIVELCHGDTAQLSAQGGNSYRWSPGAFLSDSTISNPLAWPRGNTKYTLTVTDSNGCVTSKDVVINIQQVVAGADVITCLGGSAQLQASGGVWYKWISEFGMTYEFNNPNIANPVVNPKKTTRYIVTAIHPSGCTTSDTVLVTITDDFKALAGDDVSICESDSIRLLAAGGSVYEWSPRTGLSDFKIANPLAYPKETMKYIVTVSTADGKCIDSDTIIVNVFKKPVANAGNDQTICIGANIQLQGSGGVRYHWLSSKNISDSLAANPVVTPDATTEYILKVTNENNCIAFDTVRITVLDKFTVDAGDSLKICRDESVQLSVKTDVSGGALQYEWFPKEGTLSDYSSPTPTAIPFKTTTYKVLVAREENGGLCFGEDSVTVVVLEKPVITAEREEITICTGDTVQISVSGGVNYHWSPGGGLNDTNIENPLAFPLKTTDYTVETENELGCKSSKRIRINVVEKENISISLKTPSYLAKVGERRNFVVDFSSDKDGFNEFSIIIRCQPDLLKIDPQSITRISGFTQDWEITGVEVSQGEYKFEAKNNGTGILKGCEFQISGDIYLAKVLDSIVKLEIISLNSQPISDNSCFTSKTVDAGMQFENVCGGPLRLVSITGEEFALQQNKPNPFSEETEIEYSIGLAGNATITLLNPMGEVVTILKDEFHRPGKYVLKFAAKELPSGAYYCQLTSGPFSATYPLVIIK